MKYDFPEVMEKVVCGGNQGELTYILTPKQKGDFVIYETKSFRGEIVSRIKHHITVS